MECYCTPSASNCGENRRKKCDRYASHCLLSLRWQNESNRYIEHIQDCWPWSTDGPECPKEPGLCYLLSESKEGFTNCCCKGPLCNGIDNIAISPPPTNRSLVMTGLDPIFIQGSRSVSNAPTQNHSLFMEHKDSFLVLIITAPIIIGIFLLFIFALFVLFLPRYRVCRLKQNMQFPRKNKTCTHCRKSSVLLFNPFHCFSMCTCVHHIKDNISNGSVAQNEYFGLNNMSKHPITGLQWLSGECVELCSFVKKVELKAHGRFGQVWLGRFSSPDIKNDFNLNSSQTSLNKNNNEVDVAIKIFTSTEKRSWEAEVSLFNVPGLEHINILQYYGADQVSVNNSMGEDRLEYWLVTEYHPLGSVYDYLHVYDIQWINLLKICTGIAQGLAHLHMEIPNLSKPSIAHRDLNSRNVLLKSDLTACIADFGLAIRFEAGQCMRDAHLQLGTRRYMAPEVLDGAIQFSKDAFLRIDVYAMGLVFWELMMRCCCGSNKNLSIHVTNYLAPFEIELGSQPSMEALQRWVAHAKQRPKFNPQWESDGGLCTLWETVEECWDQDAEARLSAGCVTKRLTTLLRQSVVISEQHNDNNNSNNDMDTNMMNNYPIFSSMDVNNQKTDSNHLLTPSHYYYTPYTTNDLCYGGYTAPLWNYSFPSTTTTITTATNEGNIMLSGTSCPPTICLPYSMNINFSTFTTRRSDAILNGEILLKAKKTKNLSFNEISTRTTEDQIQCRNSAEHLKSIQRQHEVAEDKSTEYQKLLSSVPNFQ
uniref:receptor protein serine/threonine kinase n=1 Tax=Schistosoma japonicum TaxID=6182 RepID=C1LE74_SCHJA|nr:activin receptor IIA [Schistosoma japonicum]